MQSMMAYSMKTRQQAGFSDLSKCFLVLVTPCLLKEFVKETLHALP
jgi:hypothetical protein